MKERLDAAASTPSVDLESELVSLQQELTDSRTEIEKLRAEVHICRDRLHYNRQRTSVQYTRVVNRRLMGDFRHPREAVTGYYRQRVLESEIDVATDAGVKAHEQVHELNIRLAGETVRRKRIRAVWGLVIEAMNSFDKGIDDMMGRASAMVSTLQTDLASVVNKNPRAVCEGLINPLIAEFTVTFHSPSAAVTEKPVRLLKSHSLVGHYLWKSIRHSRLVLSLVLMLR